VFKEIPIMQGTHHDKVTLIDRFYVRDTASCNLAADCITIYLDFVSASSSSPEAALTVNLQMSGP
jgi:hypothetical protein